MIPVMLLAPILFSYHVFPRKEKNFDLKCNNFYITKKISLIFLYFNCYRIILIPCSLHIYYNN